jgi:hypothetical protein
MRATRLKWTNSSKRDLTDRKRGDESLPFSFGLNFAGDNRATADGSAEELDAGISGDHRARHNHHDNHDREFHRTLSMLF